MVGYAATCKVRSADPPIVGSRYMERIDWWQAYPRNTGSDRGGDARH